MDANRHHRHARRGQHRRARRRFQARTLRGLILGCVRHQGPVGLAELFVGGEVGPCRGAEPVLASLLPTRPPPESLTYAGSRTPAGRGATTAPGSSSWARSSGSRSRRLQPPNGPTRSSRRVLPVSTPTRSRAGLGHHPRFRNTVPVGPDGDGQRTPTGGAGGSRRPKNEARRSRAWSWVAPAEASVGTRRTPCRRRCRSTAWPTRTSKGLQSVQARRPAFPWLAAQSSLLGVQPLRDSLR